MTPHKFYSWVGSLTHGLFGHATDDAGNSADGCPLSLAARANSLPCMIALLKAGADPDIWVRDGDHTLDPGPLRHAIVGHRAAAAKLLLSRGALLDERTAPSTSLGPLLATPISPHSWQPFFGAMLLCQQRAQDAAKEAAKPLATPSSLYIIKAPQGLVSRLLLSLNFIFGRNSSLSADLVERANPIQCGDPWPAVRRCALLGDPATLAAALELASSSGIPLELTAGHDLALLCAELCFAPMEAPRSSARRECLRLLASAALAIPSLRNAMLLRSPIYGGSSLAGLALAFDDRAAFDALGPLAADMLAMPSWPGALPDISLSAIGSSLPLFERAVHASLKRGAYPATAPDGLCPFGAALFHRRWDQADFIARTAPNAISDNSLDLLRKRCIANDASTDHSRELALIELCSIGSSTNLDQARSHALTKAL